MKILKHGDVLVTNDGVFRYNSESRCMERIPFCETDGTVITPKLGTGDDPK